MLKRFNELLKKYEDIEFHGGLRLGGNPYGNHWYEAELCIGQANYCLKCIKRALKALDQNVSNYETLLQELNEKTALYKDAKKTIQKII